MNVNVNNVFIKYFNLCRRRTRRTRRRRCRRRTRRPRHGHSEHKKKTRRSFPISIIVFTLSKLQTYFC